METLDLTRPLFFPRYRLESIEYGHVLIDTDRAHWIAVNDAGLETIQKIAQDGPDSVLNGNDSTRKGIEKFLSQVARREFVSNKPFNGTTYNGRHELLVLKRLHEFWVVPNYDCNLRCEHCYTIEQVVDNPHRLNFEAFQGIVDDAKALGTEIFYLTGGEVFRHPDILKMVEHIARDRKCIVFTNGIPITPEVAKDLARFRDRLIIQISIEGHNPEYNDLIRGKTAFKRAMQGLENCLRAGLRVGVSSTPCKATKDSVPQLTELLAQIEIDGRRIEYHHLIMLLDVGTKIAPGLTLLSPEEFSKCLELAKKAAKEGKVKYGSRLKVANDKIFKACASNGPRKDLCGAGYTILGVDPEGYLKTCAATINDPKYNLGNLLNPDSTYSPGRLEQLWRHGDKPEWVRRFTIARREGEPTDDLRFFHGGACWYNMTDPEGPLSETHPFYKTLEKFSLEAILEEAAKGGGNPQKDDSSIDEPSPRVLAYQHRSRISCAGGRKTEDFSEDGLDNGYCICFA